jgi:hypothetical protein
MYEEVPGWKESTDDAPSANVRKYLERLPTLVHVPISVISTGAGHDQTVVLHYQSEVGGEGHGAGKSSIVTMFAAITSGTCSIDFGTRSKSLSGFDFANHESNGDHYR